MPSPRGTPTLRRHARVDRRAPQDITDFPLPEIAPTPPTNVGQAAANVAQSPGANLTLSQPSTSPSPTDSVIGIKIPTSLSVVIPATVTIIGFFLFCLFGYWFYLWRQKKNRRTAQRGPPAIVVQFYESKMSVSTKGAELVELEPESPVSPSKTGGLPGSPRDGLAFSPRGRDKFGNKASPAQAGVPILVQFPSPKKELSGESKPGPVLPALPPVAATRAAPLKDDEATWRPVSRDSRMSARSSSLVATRLSQASAPRVPAIQVTDYSNPIASPTAPAFPGLPKLVTVIATFAATLPDEFDDIHIGETLRVLEEYADQWCLAERVGRGKAKRGVLPQFCVQDKNPLKRFSFVPFGTK